MPGLNHIYDVIVVGSRCAGAATAMLLARQGHAVLLVDRADPHGDTLSTHAIARTGVVQLQRWGLLEEVLSSVAPAIRDVTVHVEGERIERTIHDHAGVDLQVAPRRHVLDRILTNAAVDAGAELRTGVRVLGVSRGDEGSVTGIVANHHGSPIQLRARIVVGADGVRSRVARAVGAATLDVPSRPRRDPLRLLRRPALAGVGVLRRRQVVQRDLPDPRRRQPASGCACPPTTPRRCAAAVSPWTRGST